MMMTMTTTRLTFTMMLLAVLARFDAPALQQAGAFSPALVSRHQTRGIKARTAFAGANVALSSSVTADDHDMKYAHVHGPANKSPASPTDNDSPTVVSVGVRDQLEHITDTRPFPLFMLEKAAAIVDGCAARLATATKPKEATSPHARAVANTKKEKMVILGTGWGAASILKGLTNSDKYDITVISPRNHFVFTPLLTSASTGTVEVRSITEPVRELNRNAQYLEAAATGIDTETRMITCRGVVCDDECEVKEFDVDYDLLVVSVGAKVNDFGISGVKDHCLFLKQAEDARKIRSKLQMLFEQAGYPHSTDEEKQRLLTFAIIGGGPSGVECASEIRDFVRQDARRFYPDLIKHVRIKIIEAGPTVLNSFDQSLQEAAIEQLTMKEDVSGIAVAPTELLLEKKVAEVTEDKIILSDGTQIQYGMSVWCGGIGPLPITLKTIEALGEEQAACQDAARGKLAVDPWLRAIGGDGSIFAIGDCASTATALPPTAQVANQEGEYLASLFTASDLSAEYDGSLLLPPRRPSGISLAETVASVTTKTKNYMAPFQLLDMGQLAFTGDSTSVVQLNVCPSDKGRVKASNRLGYELWKSIYLYKQPSLKKLLLVGTDMLKSRIFGRDITTLN